MNHPGVIIFISVALSVAAVILLLLLLKPYLISNVERVMQSTQEYIEPDAEQPKNENESPVNVLDYGADPTGHEDSTAAIREALKGNRHLYFPAGTYLIDKLVIAGSVTLSGDGDNATVLRTTNMTDNVITFRDGGWHVRDLKFDSAQYRTGGAYIFSSGDYASIENVALNRSYIGIDLDVLWMERLPALLTVVPSFVWGKMRIQDLSTSVG